MIDAFSQAICVRVCDKAPIQPLLCRPKPPRKLNGRSSDPNSFPDAAAGSGKIAARRVAWPPSSSCRRNMRLSDWHKRALRRSPTAGHSSTCQRHLLIAGHQDAASQRASASPHKAEAFLSQPIFSRRETSASNAPWAPRGELFYDFARTQTTSSMSGRYLQRPGQQPPAKAFCPPRLPSARFLC